MRHLTFAQPRSLTQQAEAAAALRWLESQLVPDGFPVGVATQFRYIVAVARQYQSCGLGVLELVMAGYRAGLVSLNGEACKTAGLWGWRVREEMIKVVQRKQQEKISIQSKF